jgi:hypothetical protein
MDHTRKPKTKKQAKPTSTTSKATGRKFEIADRRARIADWISIADGGLANAEIAAYAECFDQSFRNSPSAIRN